MCSTTELHRQPFLWPCLIVSLSLTLNKQLPTSLVPLACHQKSSSHTIVAHSLGTTELTSLLALRAIIDRVLQTVSVRQAVQACYPGIWKAEERGCVQSQPELQNRTFFKT